MGEDERPRSFGIGGAGNIRTRTEAMVHDIIPLHDQHRRRRSSLWSLGSSSNSNGESRSFKLPGGFKNVFGGSSRKSVSDTTK
ncbi:hypothetical protein F5X99DRAFT_402499 [Biscogniauxia marginata]|nr:hypothetical protein F5X99DRAFT_402499 [Biscogniauxia marginata]